MHLNVINLDKTLADHNKQIIILTEETFALNKAKWSSKNSTFWIRSNKPINDINGDHSLHCFCDCLNWVIL